MYDRTGGGSKLRTYTSVNLAWWHTFKLAAQRIWKKFALDVFAPLWHFLYPSHNFFLKPNSFVCIQAHFVWLLMATPKVQPTIAALLGDDSVRGPARVFIADLDFLLNIAIPVVTPLSFFSILDAPLFQRAYLCACLAYV